MLHLRLLPPGEGTAGLLKLIPEIFLKIFGNGVTSAQPARVGGSQITSEGWIRKKLQAQHRNPSPSPDSWDLFPLPHPVPALQLELVSVLAQNAAGYSHPRSVCSFLLASSCLCHPSLGTPGRCPRGGVPWEVPPGLWVCLGTGLGQLVGSRAGWGCAQGGSGSTPMSPLLTAASP